MRLATFVSAALAPFVGAPLRGLLPALGAALGVGLGVGLSLGAARPAAAAPSCQRPAEQPEPLWFTEHGYPRYGDRFVCPPDAPGAYLVHVTVVNGKQRTEIDEPKKRDVPNRRQPDDFFVLQEIADSVCRNQKPPPGADLVLVGPPGDEELRFFVGVEARFEGQGALASLSRTVTGRYPCRAFEGTGSSLYFRILEHEKSANLEVSLDPDWYAAAKRGASLEVRLFRGEDQREALGSIVPDLVIPLPLAQIDAAVHRNGDDLVGKVGVPWSKLCPSRRPGDDSWIAWELWGDGVLFKAGGGGRSVTRGLCR